MLAWRCRNRPVHPHIAARVTLLGVDVYTVANNASTVSEPAWIRFLKEVAVLAVPRPLVPPRRILLGLPTGEMAAAILAALHN